MWATAICRLRGCDIQEKLHHFGSALKGTKQWKGARRQELQDLAARPDLGLPHFFLTGSAADYHWDQLQRILVEAETGDPCRGEVPDARRAARVIDNPALVDAFFVERVRILLEYLTEEWRIRDYWLIFE